MTWPIKARNRVTKLISIVFARSTVKSVAPEGENGPLSDMMRPYFGPMVATQRNRPDMAVEYTDSATSPTVR
jgi:hypothetical protein